MQRKFQIAIGLLWLGPAVMFLQYWLVWDRLPLKVATHFGANGQPNGWMSRGTAAVYPLIPLLALLLIATFALSRLRKPDVGLWAILGVFYVVFGALIAITQQIIAFNLGKTPVRLLPVMGVVFAGILFCMVVFLVTKRGAALPEGDVVAEEVHGSRAWAFLFLLPMALFAWLFFHIPDFSVRAILGLASLMFVLVVAFAWSGFHYRFTHAGLEIPTLGLRLRSIPKEQIRAYHQDSWNVLGGYGIRGLGENRAYVWCNSGVRITTFGGSVFLGHVEPQRLVHDLDMLTGTTH
jgi:Protein of unknown function (DUF1648)